MNKLEKEIFNNKQLKDLLERTYFAYQNGIQLRFTEHYETEILNHKIRNFKEFIHSMNLKFINPLCKIIENEKFDKDEVIYGFLYTSQYDIYKSSYLLTNKKIIISGGKDFSYAYDIIDIMKIKSYKTNAWGKIQFILNDDKVLIYKLTQFPLESTINTLIEQSDMIANQLNEILAEKQEEFNWMCPSCFEKNSYDMDKCKVCNSTCQEIEIKENDKINSYNSFKQLEREIINKRISVNSNIRTKAGSDKEWKNFEIFAKDTPLTKYFEPVLTTAKKYGIYGMMIGVILKALDTTVFFFSIDETLGVLWLVAIGGLIISNWLKISYIAIAIILGYIFVKIGVSGNLFITILAVIFIGTIIGYPFGLIIGSIAGQIKRWKGKVVHDSKPEKFSNYLKGIIVPIIFLSILIPLYFLWFNPLILNWLNK